MQEMFHPVVAKGSDHRRREPQCNRLQHQAFGCVPRFHVDVPTSAISILDRGAFKHCRNADDRWRSGDPLLTKHGIDKLLTLMSGGYEQEFVVPWTVAVHAAGQSADIAANGIEFQRIERTCGGHGALTIGCGDALRRPQELAELVLSQRLIAESARRSPLRDAALNCCAAILARFGEYDPWRFVKHLRTIVSNSVVIVARRHLGWHGRASGM
jgi:hypothetical protein